MRVCGGSLRGRRLRTATGRDTRPTSERAREGLFSWLGDRVQGAAVLDLFAGSGALGIEALSRGADSALFVERARPALGALRRNLEELGLEARARVLRGEAGGAVAGLRRSGQRFDLVLADPPYAGDDWARLAKQANLVDILAPGGVLLAERSRREEPWTGDAGLVRLASKQYGETAFDWYEIGREQDQEREDV